MEKIVVNELNYSIRKKFGKLTIPWHDLTAKRLRQIEQLRVEKEIIRKGIWKEQVAYLDNIELEEEDGDQEALVFELQSGPPYVCLSLRPAKGKEKTSSNAKSYSFNITKAEQIFDILLKDKQLKLLKGHKIPPIKEIKK